jgi:hypothetical protein
MLDQIYSQLTHFLFQYHCTLNNHLLSHQINIAQPAGFFLSSHFALFLSYHYYSDPEDTASQTHNLSSSLHLLFDLDSLPKIVILSDTNSVTTVNPDYNTAT